MTDRSCASCQAFDPQDQTNGFCKRFAPPVSNVVGGYLRGAWPEVLATDWCLDFVALDPPVSPPPPPPPPPPQGPPPSPPPVTVSASAAVKGAV